MKAPSARSCGGRTRSPGRSIRSRRPPPPTAAGGPATLTIPVSDDWRSGYYSVTLTSGEERADAFFVIRPERASSPILLVLSTATYNAYNDWGGPSLYTGGTRVSFERPLARGFLSKPEPAVEEGAGPARPRSARVLHVGRGARSVPLERRLGVVDVGTAVRRVGRTRGFRDRRRHLAGPRSTSRGPGRPSTLPLGGARRVLVVGDARCRRGVHRRRWQRRVLQREHVLVAGPLRRRSDGRASSTEPTKTPSSARTHSASSQGPGRIGGSGGRNPR